MRTVLQDWVFADTGYEFVLTFASEDARHDQEIHSNAIADIAGGVAYRTDGEYGYTVLPWHRLQYIRHTYRSLS